MNIIKSDWLPVLILKSHQPPVQSYAGWVTGNQIMVGGGHHLGNEVLSLLGNMLPLPPHLMAVVTGMEDGGDQWIILKEWSIMGEDGILNTQLVYNQNIWIIIYV